jgi:uncharacterized membrane protein YkvA (DUF1232 family)
MVKKVDEEPIAAQEMSHEEAEKLKEKIIFVDEDKRMQFYENLRQKVRAFSREKGGKAGVLTEYLFLLPDLFILAYRLAMDDRVPAKKKIIAGAILTYLVLPIDIIPDFIPVIGHLDDLVLAVFGLNMILNEIDKQILVDHWSGEGNILELLQTISGKAEQFLDKNILQKIKNWINKKA